MRRSGILFLLGISLLAARPVLTSADEPPTLKRILATWKARQERVRSFHFAWKISSNLPNWGQHGETPHALEFDLAMQGNDQVSLEGAFVDHRNGKERDLSWRRRSTCQSKMHSRFVLLGKLKLPGEPAATGDAVISQEQNVWGDTDMQAVFAFPVRMIFRPLQFLGDVSQRPVRLVTDRAILDGLHCVKLEQPIEKSGITYWFWVDPARDDVVIRWEYRVQGLGEPFASLAIDYRHDNQHGWVPTRWQAGGVYRPSGWEDAAARPSKSVVTQFAINEPLPGEKFVGRFPQGTTVFDRPGKEVYVTGHDGSRTHVFKTESPDAARLQERLWALYALRVESTSLRDALEFLQQGVRLQIFLNGQPLAKARLDRNVEVETGDSEPLRTMLKDLLSQYPRPVDLEIRFRTSATRPFGPWHDGERREPPAKQK